MVVDSSFVFFFLPEIRSIRAKESRPEAGGRCGDEGHQTPPRPEDAPRLPQVGVRAPLESLPAPSALLDIKTIKLFEYVVVFISYCGVCMCVCVCVSLA